MITNLHIKNIGIIDDLEIDLNKGMTVLTGETGAGKTLIIDSISIICGGRFSKEMIRKGENHSYVELCMYVPNDVNSIDGNIIITREIYNNGRNMCKINGRLVTVTELKNFMSNYIEIHGQNDNQKLLDSRTHIKYLDNFSGEEIFQLKNEYKEKYPNKITAIEQENKGVARTRNESIKRATGKYIMFMDNDDYLDKDYIETFVKEIEKDDCDAVIGGYRRITETGKILKTLKLNDGEWSKYMIMAPWAKIYRTQYLIQNDITFLENNLGEDMYFNLKALLLGNVKSIDYVGYNWFFNTKSVSNTIQKNITQLQVFELIDSCYNMLKENGILEKNYEMIEAHFIKYIIWLILFSTKKLDYKTISKEYDKLFNWLKQKFPNYKKNKVVRLWKPKGELFSIRLIVITMSIANKVGLGKVLVYVYSIL